MKVLRWISLKNSSVFDWFIYKKPRSGVCHPQLSISQPFPMIMNQGGWKVLCRQGDEYSRKNRAAMVKQTPISLKNSSVFDWFIYVKSLGGICNLQLVISQPFPMITNDDRCQDRIAQQATIICNRQRGVGVMISNHVKWLINQFEKLPALSP